ncbi:Plp2p Ecym_6249 [Eremothecium cymbalariae DBVPG|uniref:Phosducin domain-containing protein n=1 Tax=Eremothecium cymbalariae (strain CBS 270.75 / DBVPG 7215 / KCTC 17166 / NRRL Y-17582) TaxID=931890 RepID=G8JVF2_ERECY|nr:hypothetical protein Ecym_6249 [Eremothecium cymbalariae DBVPG\
MNFPNEPKFQIEVDEREDTEWNDILRQRGIIPERPPSPSAQLEEALEEAIQKQHKNRLEDKSLSDLEELEDDEDQEFLEYYKRKRMAELRQQQVKAKFGEVFHVDKPEYNKEITECSNSSITKGTCSDSIDNEDSESEGVYVFVHLKSEGKLQSRLLSSLFQQVAPKFPQIKFVEILANRAIENYPEANTPTLLVYYKGDVIKNIVTLVELGGNSTTLGDLEKLMVSLGAVDNKDSRLLMNEDDEDARGERHFRYTNNSTIRSGVADKFRVGLGNANGDNDDFFD